MIETTRWARKPFFVDAVQVTEDNFEAVAEWCGGKVLETYVSVPVRRPLNARQTHALVGDWVLKAGKGFKVYTDKAMTKNFDQEV